MANKPKSIPEGPRAITPYLTCRDAARAIDFYKRAFGAVETMRLANSDGRIGHAELLIAGSPIMLSDESPDFGAISPQTLNGTSVAIHLYVEDADAVFNRAVAAGAKPDRPLRDEFYGDRTGTLVDPFGHRWFVASRIEEVSPEEMKKRYEQMVAQAKS